MVTAGLVGTIVSTDWGWEGVAKQSLSALVEGAHGVKTATQSTKSIPIIYASAIRMATITLMKNIDAVLGYGTSVDTSIANQNTSFATKIVEFN